MSGTTKESVVLLVEDSPSDALLTAEALEECDIPLSIHTVPTGAEALNYLNRLGDYADAPRPSIVLVDLHLPDMSGLEVLRAMKADPTLEVLPVVIMTDEANREDEIQGYRLHASTYMTKPVDVEKIANAIRRFDEFWFGIVDLPLIDD